MPSEPSGHRLHPLSVLFSLAGQARNLLLPAIVLLFTARSGSEGVDRWDWQVWTPLLLIPYAVYVVARYLSFRYRYEEGEIVIRTGIFFRNERHVPYSRIQNLDAVQNVFHRMLGVVEVRVETGSGGEAEAKMSVLPVSAYEEMRRRVFQGKGQEKGAEPADREVPAGTSPALAARTLLALPLRELILLGVLQNRGGVAIAAVFGLLWEMRIMDRFMGRIVDEKTVGRHAIREALRVPFDLGEALSGRIVFAVLAFLGFLLLLRLISMGWTAVRLYGFRLTAEGEDLRAEYGLLTRVNATVPLRRIQTLTIHEGPLFRLFGRAAVRVDTAGGGGREWEGGEEQGEEVRQREWLAPILRREELPGFLREVLPGLDLADLSRVDWQPPHPRAFSRALKTSLVEALLVALAFVIVPALLTVLLPALRWWWGFALLPVCLAWAFVYTRQHVRHLGWAVTEDMVLFRSGWLWREVSVARFAKIQSVAVHESPFDRRAAMARVRVDTAGAGASLRIDIPFLARETALQLRDLLAARAARSAFRW